MNNSIAIVYKSLDNNIILPADIVLPNEYSWIYNELYNQKTYYSNNLHANDIHLYHDVEQLIITYIASITLPQEYNHKYYLLQCKTFSNVQALIIHRKTSLPYKIPDNIKLRGIMGPKSIVYKLTILYESNIKAAKVKKNILNGELLLNNYIIH